MTPIYRGKQQKIAYRICAWKISCHH